MHLFNQTWCTDSVIAETYSSADLGYLIIKCRPFYLPEMQPVGSGDVQPWSLEAYSSLEEESHRLSTVSNSGLKSTSTALTPCARGQAHRHQTTQHCVYLSFITSLPGYVLTSEISQID